MSAVAVTRRWASFLLLVGILAGGGVLALWIAGKGALDDEAARRAAAVEEITTAAFAARRADFSLNWTPGPPGTTYDVVVTDESGRPLASATALARPTYRIDEAALAAVPPGKRVLWRVTIQKPFGKAVQSRTFGTTLLD